MKKLALVIAVSLILSACATTGRNPAPIESATNAANNTSQGQNQGQEQALSQAEVEARKLADQQQKLESQSIYFDFDSSGIKSQYDSVITNQADFLNSHSNVIVTLEGNCDERGSSEYNLALGQRRAYTVGQKLELLGVPARQIKTISFGEEKPRLTCHAERCWKENRRVDFDYKSNL